MTINFKNVDGKTYYKLVDIAHMIKVTSLDYAIKKSGASIIKLKVNHVEIKFIDIDNINKISSYFRGKESRFVEYAEIIDKWIDSVTTVNTDKNDKKVDDANGYVPDDNLANDLLRKFISQQFGLVRVVIQNNEPWFVAADVCKALELSDTNMSLKRLDEDEKGTSSICTPGGNQEMSIINESGLYSLVLGSRKPEAKAFKRWITHEVIPAIRNHGVYATAETAERLMNDPDFMIKTFTALKEEREKNQKLSEENDRLNMVNQGLVHNTKTWDKRAVLNRLIRCLAYNGGFCGDYRYAYNTLYTELRYKKGICLTNRTGGKNLADRIHENEWEDVLEVAIALCEENGINVKKAINEVNAKAVIK